MKTDDLLAYEERERAFVRANGDRAVTNGFVTDTRCIYSDRRLPGSLAFHRSGAPLAALLLLYEKTVVYIPPTTRDKIEARIGFPWSDLLTLVDRGCIQPIIGHPAHYARKPFFDDLLSFDPPSVWARGDELARRFANADEYWAMTPSVLPLPQMCAVKWVRAKFRRHFPSLSEKSLSERIATELCTNFVDLCIYGYEPLARDIAGLSDHDWSARRILEISELLTYPTLMGLGGTANYGLASSAAIDEAISAGQLSTTDVREIPPEAQILLDGLSINVPSNLNADLVVQFHHDGMAKPLWHALEELETQVAASAGESGSLVDSAVVAERLMNATMRELRGVGFRRQIGQSQRQLPWVDLTVKVGAAALLTVATHAPIGSDWMTDALAGAQFAGTLYALKFADRITARVERRVSEAITARTSSRLATQLWWLTEWRRGAVHG
jgi:hypothetical protein